MCFLVATADGDRHSWSDGGSDRPRGRRGPEPSLSEGRQAEAVGQAEELKRCWTSTEGTEKNLTMLKLPDTEENMNCDFSILALQLSCDTYIRYEYLYCEDKNTLLLLL